MSAVASAFLIYVALLLALTVWSRHGTRTLNGYFLADRKLPAWVIAFSTNATGESGWLMLGLTGMGYAVGAQAFWVVAGEVIGIAAAWIFIAKKLKKISDEHHCITVPDVLAARFVDRANILRAISVTIILIMVGAYVSAQIVAAGKTFSGFMDMSYSAGVILGAATITAYTFFGGYKAVAYTDVAQGVLMLLVLIVVPIVAISAAGGWTATMSALEMEQLTSVWMTGTAGPAPWIVILSFLAVGLPFLGVPQLMVRFMSARDEGEISKARWISVGVILAFDTGAVLTGMAGRALFPGLEDPETILPLLSGELFPPIAAGVIMVTVLAAIMSTADSLLLLASSALVRDLLQKIYRSVQPDAVLARYGKIAVLLIGAGATAFALRESQVIFWFVLFAWSGLGAAFGPVIICGLFVPTTTLPGAIAGMLGGFITTVVWALLLKERFYDLYEMIPGLIVGLALTLLVSLATQDQRSNRRTAEI